MGFPMICCFAKIKIFRFWPKTMDYSQVFWPKLRSFLEDFLLLTGRCYKAEIWTIMLLLRCSFAWLLKRKLWTVVRGLIKLGVLQLHHSYVVLHVRSNASIEQLLDDVILALCSSEVKCTNPSLSNKTLKPVSPLHETCTFN